MSINVLDIFNIFKLVKKHLIVRKHKPYIGTFKIWIDIRWKSKRHVFLDLKIVITCLKNDLNFTILTNAKTMLKSKSRPRLSDNPGTGGGRLRCAPKRKATPAAESAPNVQSSVASKKPSLY